jgi:hypothetical protein
MGGGATSVQQLTTVAPPAPVVPYQVRLADVVRDEQEILRLCKAGALHCPPEKYQWNYAANPLRQAWCSLAIERANQSAVGTTALFPRRILVDGVPFSAAVSGDFAVDPQHRTLYPALALQKAAVTACRSGSFDILYGFPNDAARPVQIRAGYRVVGRIRVGIRPLRLRRTLERAVRELHWLPGTRILDSLISLASKESRVRIPTQYRYSVLPAFDERFDRFWVRTLHRHRVVVERNSVYANWRFISCPSRKYSLFVAIHSNTGEVGGYILSWSDEGRTHISDILANEDAFDGLLTLFINQQREQGAHCITIVYFGGSWLVRKIRRFGFLFRSTRSEVLLYTKPDLPAADLLSCPDNWYLLDGDSDF